MKVELTTWHGALIVLDGASVDRARGVFEGRTPNGAATLVPLESVKRQRLVEDRYGRVAARN